MCTTMIAGKKATVDGTVLVAHSDDDVGDERLILVPSRPNTGYRNIYYDNAALGPRKNADGKLYNSTEIRRYIGSDRGPDYEPVKGEGYHSSIAIGKIDLKSKLRDIPFRKTTFKYFDSSYGVVNEKGLMFGECTCGAKVHPEPDPQKRLFYSAELSRVALENCETAQEAIRMMGQLIRDYGYYGTGETLLIGDSSEAWVMEMCGYNKKGTNGIWVAQRVPEDHFFVAANQFRIRDIVRSMVDQDSSKVSTALYTFSLDDKGNRKDDLIYSSNLFEACENEGWIEKNSPVVDWAATVSFGEYLHPYYSLRRVWRAFSKAAPHSNLPAKVENGYTKAYPFSLKPEKLFTPVSLAEVYRDHYENTQFDLTEGLAAAPYGTPVRYENNPDKGNTWDLAEYYSDGAWERPLSIYRCGMMWINQCKMVQTDSKQVQKAVCWLGLDRPVAGCLMPFPADVDALPPKVKTMNLLEFSFKGDSAWWAFNFVANYLNLHYNLMIRDLVSTRTPLEEEALNISTQYLSGQNSDPSQFATHAEYVIKKWWSLAVSLIVKYNDGCITRGPNQVMEKVDYSPVWLNAVKYQDGPTSY